MMQPRLGCWRTAEVSTETCPTSVLSQLVGHGAVQRYLWGSSGNMALVCSTWGLVPFLRYIAQVLYSSKCPGPHTLYAQAPTAQCVTRSGHFHLLFSGVSHPYPTRQGRRERSFQSSCPTTPSTTTLAPLHLERMMFLRQLSVGVWHIRRLQ